MSNEPVSRRDALEFAVLLAAIKNDARVDRLARSLLVGDDNGCGFRNDPSRKVAKKVHGMAVQIGAYDELADELDAWASNWDQTGRRYEKAQLKPTTEEEKNAAIAYSRATFARIAAHAIRRKDAP